MEIKPEWWWMGFKYSIWTSMPILSHYNSYYWTSMPILSQCEKLLSVLSHPAGLLSRKNDDFWNFGTYPFSKSVYFLILNNFSKNGSPGQTTMLMRRAAKFCVEPRSPFSYISHHDPKTLGKPLIIVSWPECQPEFPSDGDDGGFPRTLSIRVLPWEYHAQEPNIPCGESLTSTK